MNRRTDLKTRMLRQVAGVLLLPIAAAMLQGASCTTATGGNSQNGGDNAQNGGDNTQTGGDASQNGGDNSAPSFLSVDAGSPLTVNVGVAVSLSGTATDPDPAAGQLTFSWKQVSGPTVNLAGADTQTPVFTAPGFPCMLTFELTVTAAGNISETATTTVTVTGGSLLLVANFFGDSVTGFANPATLSGNVAPTFNLAGDQTQLVNPLSVAVDKNGALLVVTGNNILGFNNPYAGNTPPTSGISGSNTGLNFPTSIVYDPNADRLYVANTFPSSISAFDGISTLNGIVNLVPTVTITNAAIQEPIGLAVDGQGNLYVADGISNSVVVYDAPGAPGGDVAPSRTIASYAFQGIGGICIYNDDLFSVTLSGADLLMFANASDLHGQVTPVNSVSVPFSDSLKGVAVDSAGNVFVTDTTKNSVGVLPDLANQGATPTINTISGPLTLLNGPALLAVSGQ